jgi:hypothetical protein
MASTDKIGTTVVLIMALFVVFCISVAVVIIGGGVELVRYFL